MKITEVEITPVKPNKGLVAFASFVLGESLYLSSIGIITRPEGGYRLAYPTKKVGERSMNIFHPINKAFATEIEQLVVTRFEEVMNYDRHSSTNT